MSDMDSPGIYRVSTQSLAQTLFKPGLKIDFGFRLLILESLKLQNQLKTTLSKRIKQSYRFEITVGTKGRGKQNQGTVMKIQTRHRNIWTILYGAYHMVHIIWRTLSTGRLCHFMFDLDISRISAAILFK